MNKVTIDLGERSYNINIGANLLIESRELISRIEGDQVFVITNEVVAPLYLQQLLHTLEGKNVEKIILADGEETKTLETAGLIFDKMLQIQLNRSVTVVALGGGVIGDMAGFVAACYQRGVPYIQIPTTLLSQVDSSVGGKTAVNHALGKNMIGAFYQPKLVLADISTLSSLDSRQFSSGLAEVIKYGLINDAAFFGWLEQNIDPVMAQEDKALEYIISKSCLNKARIVEQDEKESGIRALLNFGHTFGHAIETTSGYGKWLHGEAVAQGMVMAAHMSNLSGMLPDSDMLRIIELLKRAGLPTSGSEDLDHGKMIQAMKLDKKVENGRIRLVLLEGIGKAFVTDEYDESHLDSTLRNFTGDHP